ncbi:DNA sulfur modification protein DndB [Tissierella praeacuta]|uniref:DNA sulfur modification protein DndB n=1 Tax=Tissierella praeacuta TaxID=43131 RepID=UPI003DA2FACE
MKVGMTKDKIVEELYKELYEVNLTKNNHETIFKGLINKGYLAGDAQQIIAGNTALEILDEIQIGIIASVFYKVTNNALINPENYYDKVELEQINKTKLEVVEDEIKLPVVFENMIKYAHDMWVGKISLQKFVKLHQSGISTYNFETQRNPIYKKYKGTAIKRININPDSVSEITNKIIKKSYLYDDITLNILSNGEEDFEFKRTGENIGDLIFKGGSLNLTDGAHRLKGAEGALLITPDLEGNFILVITNFNTNKANEYIKQKDKRNPISKEYLESKDMESLSNDIVRNINEDSISDIRGKIVTDEYLLSEGFGVTMFSIMSKTIDQLWNPQTRRDTRNISDYLIDFFNELVGLFPEELKLNIKENRDKNYINHPNMIIYYLTLAKEIEGNEHWRDILYNILNQTDFTVKNEFWKETIHYIYPSNLKDTRLARVINRCRDNILERVK